MYPSRRKSKERISIPGIQVELDNGMERSLRENLGKVPA
jgi:hypothetical protein